MVNYAIFQRITVIARTTVRNEQADVANPNLRSNKQGDSTTYFSAKLIVCTYRSFAMTGNAKQ